MQLKPSVHCRSTKWFVNMSYILQITVYDISIYIQCSCRPKLCYCVCVCFCWWVVWFSSMPSSFTSLKLHGVNHLATLPFGKQRTVFLHQKHWRKSALRILIFDNFRIFIQGKNKTTAVCPTIPTVAGCCVSTVLFRAAGFLNLSHPPSLQASLISPGGRFNGRGVRSRKPTAILTFEKRSKVFTEIS